MQHINYQSVTQVLKDCLWLFSLSYGPLYPIIDNFLSQSRKERKGYAQLTTRTIFAASWCTLRLGEGMSFRFPNWNGSASSCLIEKSRRGFSHFPIFLCKFNAFLTQKKIIKSYFAIHEILKNKNKTTRQKDTAFYASRHSAAVARCAALQATGACVKKMALPQARWKEKRLHVAKAWSRCWKTSIWNRSINPQ